MHTPKDQRLLGVMIHETAFFPSLKGKVACGAVASWDAWLACARHEAQLSRSLLTSKTGSAFQTGTPVVERLSSAFSPRADHYEASHHWGVTVADGLALLCSPAQRCRPA